MASFIDSLTDSWIHLLIHLLIHDNGFHQPVYPILCLTSQLLAHPVIYMLGESVHLIS